MGNAMNVALTLAVQATLCRELGRPFVFPGSAQQWNGLTDLTDARLVAEQMVWAAETPGAANQAFNIVNGRLPLAVDVAAARRVLRGGGRGIRR